jgi:polyphosphate kinase
VTRDKVTMAKTQNGRPKSAKSSGDKLLGLFDIENPKLHEQIDDAALASGGYPYEKRLKREDYEEQLGQLQSELLKLQIHVRENGERVLVIFEGRDAAGKGTCIGRFLEHLNTRYARSVALNKPTEIERTQWYFQRYISHLPAGGDIVLFDRSWYNRAGVERVMKFCDDAQLASFLRDVPDFEELLARDGIRVFKFFLVLGREMQLKRFHERRHDPFKRWKLSPIDTASIEKWDDYSKAHQDIFRFTHTASAPWTVIRSNDQRRARLESIRWVLNEMDYAGKDKKLVGKPDPQIAGTGPDLLVV